MPISLSYELCCLHMIKLGLFDLLTDRLWVSNRTVIPSHTVKNSHSSESCLNKAGSQAVTSSNFAVYKAADLQQKWYVLVTYKYIAIEKTISLYYDDPQLQVLLLS